MASPWRLATKTISRTLVSPLSIHSNTAHCSRSLPPAFSRRRFLTERNKDELMVDVRRLELPPPCLQSRLEKTLNALSGVAYTETGRNSRSSNVPKLYRSP